QHGDGGNRRAPQLPLRQRGARRGCDAVLIADDDIREQRREEVAVAVAVVVALGAERRPIPRCGRELEPPAERREHAIGRRSFLQRAREIESSKGGVLAIWVRLKELSNEPAERLAYGRELEREEIDLGGRAARRSGGVRDSQRPAAHQRLHQYVEF